MDEFLRSLDKIETLSNTALTLAACVVVGYLLRFIKKFPNDGIPLAVILNGALVFPLLADPRDIATSMHSWIIRQIIAGAILGTIAWMGHKFFISRLEDWLAGRFEIVGKVLRIKPESTDPAPTDKPNP